MRKPNWCELTLKSYRKSQPRQLISRAPSENPAEWYAKELGWSILPLHGINSNGACACRRQGECCHPGKHPKTKHGVRDATKDVGQVSKWFKRWPEANVGIATGRPSDFFVMDIDPKNGGSIEALEAVVGKLPETVTVATGGGGIHLFFRCNGVYVKNRVAMLPGIDVRGDFGYVVAPPSKHVCGRKYEWTHAPLLFSIANPTDCLLERLKTEDAEGEEEPIACVRRVFTGLSDELSARLCRTIPTAESRRNRRIFDLARILKFHPETSGKRPVELHNIVIEWHEAALPAINTKPFEVTWNDFKYAHRRALRPIGPTLAEIAARAAKRNPPSWAAAYGDPRAARLICVLLEMQLEAGEKPFFLGCREAGDLIDAGRTAANDWLTTFMRDGILKRVVAGFTGRSSEYLFLGDPA